MLMPLFDASKHTIEFFPEEHKYVIDGEQVISVTQLLSKHHISNYGNFVNEVMKEAMAAGTLFHKEAEAVAKGVLKVEDMISKEAQQFKEWYLALPFKPLFAELICHYGKVFAGTCDMIYQDKNEKLVLVDYKTGAFHKKEHTWQINLYRIALATMGIFIDRMEVWCFKENTIYQIDTLSDDEIYELLAAEQTGHILGEEKTLAITDESDKALIDTKNAFLAIRNAVLMAKEIEDRFKDLKKVVFDFMKENGATKLTSDVANFTFVAPKDKDAFDDDAFKKDYPDLFKAYSYKKASTPYIKATWVKEKKEEKEKQA